LFQSIVVIPDCPAAEPSIQMNKSIPRSTIITYNISHKWNSCCECLPLTGSKQEMMLGIYNGANKTLLVSACMYSTCMLLFNIAYFTCLDVRDFGFVWNYCDLNWVGLLA